MSLESFAFGTEGAPPHPERYVNETDECRHLDQRSDDAHESLAGVEAEHGDRYRYRQLEIVAGCGERERSRLCVVSAKILHIQKLTRNMIRK